MTANSHPTQNPAIHCPHLYAIDASKPFIDVLACHLLEDAASAPHGLARSLVFVPNRRAIPALRKALAFHSGGKPLLLPRIQALGDADLELLVPELLFGEEGQALLGTDTIPATRRTLELAKMVGAFFSKFGDEVFSPDQSVLLAQSLGDLIDDLAREQVDFAELRQLVPEEYAEHWQKTLTFLAIIGEQWPARLKELGGIDAVARRNVALAALSGHWSINPPDYPVIAAGTTGSIEATSRLLYMIAGLPHGQVILPGLDLHCDDEEWQAVDASHPQYGLKRLLGHFGCDRKIVQRLDSSRIEGAPAERMELISEAMVPAELSARWRDLQLDVRKALASFSMIEFDHDEQEAAAIALMLRQSLEEPGKSAMLVTHDRSLARRVSIRLKRYGIDCEDGGGLRLLETRSASLLFTVLELLQDDASPVALLALLKHPLCGLELSIDERLRAVSELEQSLLRGVRPAGGLDGLLALAERKELSGDVEAMLRTLCRDLLPLRALFKESTLPLERLLESLIDSASAIAQLPGDPGGNLLWAGTDGRMLSRVLAEIARHAPHAGPVSPRSMAGILRSLLQRETYHPPGAGHPRLVILGPVEARMQHADLVVMAGLNEECWPPAAAQDPWMNRAMRERTGLEPHERMIGLSAHDFFSLSSAPRVIVTRARKVGETPRLASRWWQRLMAVIEALGAADSPAFTAPGEQWRHWATEAEHAESTPRQQRPIPTPPLDARPRRLSISDVEKLLADPYSLYARRVLNLRSLETLDKEPGAAEFGNAVHQALATFFNGPLPPLDAASEARLHDLLEHELRSSLRRDELPVFWQRRVGMIAAEVMRGEAERRAAIVSVTPEMPLQMEISSPYKPLRLEGRLDRVDRLREGGAEILDYKTGAAPGKGDVTSGKKPQLSLEGLLLEASGESVAALLYWSFALRDNGIIHAGGEGMKDSLIEAARLGMEKLVAYYDDASHPYSSLGDQMDKRTHQDYAHLARLPEWR